MNFGDNVAEKLSLVVFEVQNITRMAVEKNAFSLMSFCSIRYLQSRKLLNLPLFPTTVYLNEIEIGGGFLQNSCQSRWSQKKKNLFEIDQFVYFGMFNAFYLAKASSNAQMGGRA